jgi:endonuclease G, mitochondrial
MKNWLTNWRTWVAIIGILVLGYQYIRQQSGLIPTPTESDTGQSDKEVVDNTPDRKPSNLPDGVLYLPEKFLRKEQHLFLGRPEKLNDNNQVVRHQLYTLSNNAKTKFADWVAYKVTANTMSGEKTERNWEPDPNLPPSATLEPKDYRGAYQAEGYQRGHQAPLGSLDGGTATHEVNYLSNITPQQGNLNEGPWRIIEEQERRFARNDQPVYVLTGPLFEKQMPPLPNTRKNHTVPSGYWKIIFVSTAAEYGKGTFRVAAFILNQNEAMPFNVEQYRTTIQQIEERSGWKMTGILPIDLAQSLRKHLDADWISQEFKDQDERTRRFD